MRKVESGEIPDILKDIDAQLGKARPQSYCGTNNGFLVDGRPVLENVASAVKLINPLRCGSNGTDRMVGLIESVGRAVREKYGMAMRLNLGDVSAPRGGCLTGSSGRRGHSSHTSGRDADIGFLIEARVQPVHFHRDFHWEINWWMLKKIFTNPYACIKVIFLDKKWIARLAKKLGNDPEWLIYRRFFRHMPGHRNHFHVRVGAFAGAPGCTPKAEEAHPELEEEDDASELEDAVLPTEVREAAEKP